jgi:hypothetical protein
MGRIFASDEKYLYWAEILIFRGNLAAVVLPVPLIVNALLQSLQYGGLTSLFTFFTQTAALPVTMAILFFTNKKDPARLIYAYPIQQGFTALVAVPFGGWALRRICNHPDAVDASDESLEDDGDDQRKENLNIDELPEG